MKKLFILLTTVIVSVSMWSQAPDKMSYQAVIRNDGGQLVANKQIGMKISILQTSVTGTVVYSETHTPVSNENGLVSIEIGSGSIVSGAFAGIDWSNGPYFIKTETDPTGGSTYSIMSTSQLLSVPYALHTKTAESFPTLTDAQRNAIVQPKEGMLIFNETTKNLNVYKNGNWYEWQATNCVSCSTIESVKKVQVLINRK